MDTENNEWWDTKKDELMRGITEAKELGTTDPEILFIMEEMLKAARISGSLTEYYNDMIDIDE